MEASNKKFYSRLHIVLLLASLLPCTTTYGAPTPSLKSTNTQDFQHHIGNQYNVLEMTIDVIGQHLYIKKKDGDIQKKAHSQNQIQILRKNVDSLKRFASVYVTPVELYQLSLYNEALIKSLRIAIDSDLAVIPTPNLEALVVKKSLSEKEITAEKISSLLKKNDVALAQLAKDSDQIGLTGINKTYRAVRTFSKKYYVMPIAEHVVVYSALAGWYLYVTGKATLEDIPLLNKLAVAGKGELGGTPKKGSQELDAPVQAMVENENSPIKVPVYQRDQKGVVQLDKNGNPIQITVLRKDKNGVEVETPLYARVMKNAQKKDFPYYEQKKIKGQKSDPGLSDLTEDITMGRAIIDQTDTSEPYLITRADSKDTTKGDDKLLSKLINISKAIVDVDNGGSVFKITTTILFATYIKNDIEKLVKLAQRKKHLVDDYLFGTAKRDTYDDITVRTERFDDIVGREDVKAELNRVIEYIRNPDRFDRAGIKVERGYLLAGEPQTGKTLMAKALAGEISAALEADGKKQKVRLFEISTDNLAKKGIAYYMELAKTQAPCILFLDELDLLRLQRDGDTKTLSEFLTSMSGSLNSNEKDHVIILAATNKPENVDFALRQHGRFGKMFWFDKPTFKHRAEFFLKECVKRCMNIQGFNFTDLAQQTEGCSFGTLDIVTKKALMNAKQENSPVTQAHFEQAINFEVRKLIPHGYTVPAEKELIIAVRQASKALTSMLLNPAKSLCVVTILPITQELEEEHVTQQYNIAGLKSKDQRAVRYGSIFAYHLHDALDIQTQEELTKQCKIQLASNVGQKAYGLTSCAYDKNDKQEAFKLSKQLVFEGVDSKEVAKQVREEKLTQAYRLLDQYELEVEKLLASHKKELEIIVTALQKRKTLTAVELYELLGWKQQATVVSTTPAAA